MGSLVVLIAAAVVGYLLGSIPTGYLAGRLLRGIDIRAHGSGSTGATNVLRTLGKGPGAVVLAIDLLKGAMAIWAAVLVSEWLGVEAEIAAWVVAVAGLAALVGHGRSVWLNFSGGKSAATGLGVLLAMAWPVALGAAVVFGAVLAVTRIVSLSSMLAALTAMGLALWFGLPLPYLLLVGAGGFYVIVRHRANVQRLLAGTEPRLGRS